MRRERPDTSNDHVNYFESWRQQLTSRRQFLIGSAAAASVCVFSGIPVSAQSSQEADMKWHDLALTTVSAVQEHLFPSDDVSPGANDINALPYLMSVLEQKHIEQSEKEFIRKGVNWLLDLSGKTYSKNFVQLNEAERESLLKKISRSRAGENWLSTLLLYIFEALLTDPIYGGNPDQVGWKWLEHQPGFPRPPADKVFTKL